MLQWTIRSQGPKSECAMLTGYGTGSETRWGWVIADDGLRYSPATGESLGVWVTESKRNGSLRLNLTQHGETHQVQT
jgi:hypothetical protein